MVCGKLPPLDMVKYMLVLTIFGNGLSTSQELVTVEDLTNFLQTLTLGIWQISPCKDAFECQNSTGNDITVPPDSIHRNRVHISGKEASCISTELEYHGGLRSKRENRAFYNAWHGSNREGFIADLEQKYHCDHSQPKRVAGKVSLLIEGGANRPDHKHEKHGRHTECDLSASSKPANKHNKEPRAA
ncbi:hypothetical protein BDV26DRAFT_296022 [Aspergillus bertholletiae]|uniref:Uncharacterized protein n=1 Tax=Aspergillus bertholletiae TaxID=1226010 RepID=A0A5N7AZT0_9EURO|nr:hypothetical protein BDV26DRAFT_296022 [Aspergillus bertholletiae]